MSQSETKQSELRWVQWLLRGVVVVHAVGLARETLGSGTTIGGYLFSEMGLEHAVFIDQLCAALILGLALAGATGRLSQRFYYPIAGWFLLLPSAAWFMGGAPYSELSVLGHATRIAAPLYLALKDERPALLRAAVSVTFFIHGVEALGLHPRFVDYLLAADAKILSMGLSQRGAELLLMLIGASDIALAAALLLRRSKGVLIYMAFWGAITACARIVHMGEFGVSEALVRVANAGVPLALLLGWSRLSPRLQLGLPKYPPARPNKVALAYVASAVLLLTFSISIAQQGPDLAPQQLRIVWAEDPAHHATLSWSTTSAGTIHRVHFDTGPQGGVPSSYRFLAEATNGQYTPNAKHYHHAELESLAPSTTYYFVLESDGVVSEERHFVTAPADERNFKLLYGGDSRSNADDRQGMNQRIAQMVEDDPEIIALAHGGDYVNDGEDIDEWDEWLTDHALTQTSAGRVLPIIPARGNHEGDGVLYNVVFNWPGGQTGDYFVTRIGLNLTLITLDSNSSVGGDQRDWLDTVLQEAQSRRWILANYHRPAYPAFKTPGGALEFWVPLFEQHNADLVLESDGHTLKRTVPIKNGQQDETGVVYVGEGGLGVSQRTPRARWYLESPGMSASVHHVQRLSFSSAQLHYEAISMSGVVLDELPFDPKRPGAVQPSPTEAESLNAHTIAVRFDRDMDPATTAQVEAYSVTPTVEINGVRTGTGLREVHLSTAELSLGARYTITIAGATDTEGAAVASGAQLEFTAEGWTPEMPEPEPPEPEPKPEQPEQPEQPEPKPAPQMPEPAPEAPGPSVSAPSNSSIGRPSSNGISGGCSAEQPADFGVALLLSALALVFIRRRAT